MPETARAAFRSAATRANADKGATPETADSPKSALQLETNSAGLTVAEPPLDFRAQLAREAALAGSDAGPGAGIVAPAQILTFLDQMGREAERDAGMQIVSFRDQLRREWGPQVGEVTKPEAPVLSFREQMARESARLGIDPLPAPLAPPVPPRPPAPRPPQATPVAPKLVPPPAPVALKPASLDDLVEVLGDDKLTIGDLKVLESRGLLSSPDREGRGTLLGHLGAIVAGEPGKPADSDRKRLLASTIRTIANPDRLDVPDKAGADLSLARAEADLVRNAPAEYARIIAGLGTGDGGVLLALGGVLRRPAGPEAGRNAGKVTASDLFRDAFAQKVVPDGEQGSFSERFDRMLKLFERDKASQDRLFKLLVSGSLGNIAQAGESLLFTLDRLANPAIKADPWMAEAFADRKQVIRKLLERLDPGPATDPRSLFARNAPGEYALLVTDLVLHGHSVAARHMTYGIDWFAKDVAAEAASKAPPADLRDYVLDLAYMHDQDVVAGRPEYQGVEAALAGDPEARAALELLALSGRLSDKGYYGPNPQVTMRETALGERAAQRESPLKLLAKLADPSTPLAAGIERRELLAAVVKGLATPFPSIHQGDWQTCTVATLQRMLGEHRPEEYIRIMTGLASPEGTVHLNEGKGREITRPADWAASAPADGRDVAGRLFQSAMMAAAVRDLNKAAYGAEGFEVGDAQAATYSNARDEWTDAEGFVHKGLPKEAVEDLAGQLEGVEYVTVEIPPGLDKFVTPENIAKVLPHLRMRGPGQGIAAVPVTLELHDEAGRPQLHEVLLGNVLPGPPAVATVIDPTDGRTKMIDMPTIAKAVKSIAFSSADLRVGLPKLLSGDYSGYTGRALGALGKDETSRALAFALPVLLPALLRAEEGAKKQEFRPVTPPEGAPSAAHLAGIQAVLGDPAHAPGRFALHRLVQSGALDQRTGAGRRLLADLQAAASDAYELPGGMTRARALELGLLNLADPDRPSFGEAFGLEEPADQADDAGARRGRFFMRYAWGGDSTALDAGARRGRFFMRYAWGGDSTAQEFRD